MKPHFPAELFLTACGLAWPATQDDKPGVFDVIPGFFKAYCESPQKSWVIKFFKTKCVLFYSP